MEIERLVTKQGATGFVSGWQGAQARVMFEMRGRRLRFSVEMPPLDDPQLRLRSFDSMAQIQKRYEQLGREKWRLLLLLIKSKLEAIEQRAAVFEEEMLPYTVMPNGQTVAEWLGPQLEARLRDGTMPPLLPG